MSTFRWWKNGDHPKDESVPTEVKRGDMKVVELTEGKVVKRYKGDADLDDLCPDCGAAFGIHGWIGGPKRGSIVHPGDYITETSGKYGVKHPNPVADLARQNEENTALEPEYTTKQESSLKE